MTAKAYFNRIKALMDNCDSLKHQVEELNADLTAIGGFDYSKPIVQTSPRNTTEDKILKLYDLISQYTDAIESCQAEIMAAESKLVCLSRPEYAKVIRLRFFGKKGKIALWGWVAEELGYSEGRTKHIFSEAMNEFEKLFLKS